MRAKVDKRDEDAIVVKAAAAFNQDLLRARRNGCKDARHILYEASLAQTQLLKMHYGMLMNLSRRWSRNHVCQHDLDDILQEARVGMLMATRTYDPSRPTRFITFASHWIRNHIQRFIVHDMLIRIPDRCVHVKPGANEFVDKARLNHLSLDVTYAHDGNPVYDVEDLHEEQGLDFTEERVLNGLLDALKPIERDVVVSRFIHGDTLSEVGLRYDLSKERIRQIQKQAMVVMRRELRKKVT